MRASSCVLQRVELQELLAHLTRGVDDLDRDWMLCEGSHWILIAGRCLVGGELRGGRGLTIVHDRRTPTVSQMNG